MVRVGVIGYGYWGPNLVRNFAETPGSEVVAVSDLRPERLALVRARYPAIRTTRDVGRAPGRSRPWTPSPWPPPSPPTSTSP